jgi:hypothetical protein
MDNNPSRALVFQAYGHRAILAELCYALHSLFALYPEAPGFVVYVYTDQASWLEPLLPYPQVRFCSLDDKKINEWRGNPPFVHRVKIKVLEDFVQGFEGSVLYLDTDVAFRSRIEPLFEAIEAGGLWMHENEGDVSSEANPILQKTHRFIKANPQYGIAPSMKMYNAGLLGFSAAQGREILPKVLALTDAVYPHFSKHIVEQMAFSWLFQQTGQALHTAEKEIYHYWFFKTFREQVLQALEQGQSLSGLKVEEAWQARAKGKKKTWWKWWA